MALNIDLVPRPVDSIYGGNGRRAGPDINMVFIDREPGNEETIGVERVDVMRGDKGLDLLQLRLVVLAIGEITTPAWWPTHFLSTTGMSFLRRIYPRSAFPAAMKATLVAARDAHDLAIGRGSYHLFRLPEHIESALDPLMSNREATTLATQLESRLGKRDDLIKMLESMAMRAKGPHTGAISVGRVAALVDGDGVGKTAGLYLAALKDDQKVFPYFEA